MKFDVAIIGGGPAGLTAGVFTCRAGLKTICFEKLAVGGKVCLTSEIENYPAYEKISGMDLAEKMFNHSSNLGVEFAFENVESLTQTKTGFSIKTKNKIYQAEKVIIACGSETKQLGLNNEKQFVGKGVSYCASCDGAFFKDKNVAIVGGGQSAFSSVKYLSRIANKIYVLNRSDKFKFGEHDLQQTKKMKNVEILTFTTVEELIGEDVLEQIKIKTNNKTQILNINGLFVNIGYQPKLDFLKINVELDENGYIIVDEKQQTNIKNLYACGDIVSKSFKQVVTACADGARAGNSCIGV